MEWTLFSKLEFYAEDKKDVKRYASSSYKIINGKNIIFQIGILCWRQTLQKIQDKIEEKLCLIKIVWCLGLLKETVWLNGNYWWNFVSIAWSWCITWEWELT